MGLGDSLGSGYFPGDERSPFLCHFWELLESRSSYSTIWRSISVFIVYSLFATEYGDN